MHHSRRRRLESASLVACLALASAGTVRADVLRQAQELRRQMQYDTARERLGIALPDLRGEPRAQALLLLADLSTDPKEARRLLRDAQSAATSRQTQLRTDLELARLDYARGSYRSVLTRLRDDLENEEAALLSALAAIALGETHDLQATLQSARRGELAQLLLGWAARQGGDAQSALVVFEQAARQRPSDFLPTTLLWKAECEAALGLRDRALQSAGLLLQRFPETPEAGLVEPTLAALRRGTAAAGPEPASAEQPGNVALQVGSFEDRTNALRFQEALAREVQPVQVQEIRDGARRLYRVQVGPFATRDLAETFGRERLTPRGYTWRIVRPEEP